LENLINLTAKKGTYQGKLLSADNQFQSRIQKKSKNLGKKKKKKSHQYPGKKKSVKQIKQSKKCKSEKFFYLVSLSSSV